MGVVMLLPNEMFDDGSIECKNFTVADSVGYYVCEWEWILNKFGEAIAMRIRQAIDKGQRYITIDNSETLEISWD